MASRRLRRFRTSSPRPEFPILEAYSLYASNIKGDGNCLFRCLSDQLYGHQGEHRALRDATIAHMRQNSDFYRQYMAVNSSRRNPKRKVTALSTRIDTTYHSEEELQRQFELHVEKMGQTGEWADNMEVSAFASALNVHVRLWQADYTYTFSPRVYYNPSGKSDDDERAVLNIAYHSWEHYSSVRNLAGPHSGLPDVTANPVNTIPSKKRPSPERNDYEVPMSYANKRRSPLPLFDSDSTPESSESSSDESNPSSISSQSQAVETSEHPLPHPKLTLKLRNTRLTIPEAAPEAAPKAASETLSQAPAEAKVPTKAQVAIEPKIQPCRLVINPPTMTDPQLLIDLTTDEATETTITPTTTTV